MTARTLQRALHRPVVAALLLTLAIAAMPAMTRSADAAPIATSQAMYDACGRVFPDPQAFWPSPQNAEGRSPWAKGNGACQATEFMDWATTIQGLGLLEELFPTYLEVYDLSDPDGPLAASLDLANGDGMSAGLPTTSGNRQKVPLHLIRVTDESSAIPIDEREHFIFTLSIHGIERAGVEGGVRAVEDLITWASCENDGDDSPAHCELEGAMPHPVLETAPDTSATAGEVLRNSVVYFSLNNPDGWRRGDKQAGGGAFQRYNGNGVDMNRDWPAQGFTYTPYTPWSEPETRSFGRVLKHIKDKWTGGIDLHGQLVDRAFSFTLIGGSERPYDKDRRVLQFTKGAWEDAETRLAWSPLIKPNDAPEGCQYGGSPPSCDDRIYGVQWGTIWDTIDYTVTGALGDWIDSPIGLDADGIDNEMSLSHLGNCGTGNCWIAEAEQLHVDGNKGLIYAMLHYAHQPEDTTFAYEGRAAWLHNPDRLTNDGSKLPSNGLDRTLPQQDPISFTINHAGGPFTATATSTYEFDVLGNDDGVYNGGIKIGLTFTNVQGESGGAANDYFVEQYRKPEEAQAHDDGDECDEDGWCIVNQYYNQSVLYRQAGIQLDVNLPIPGRYRVRVLGAAPDHMNGTAEFTAGQAWPDPGQTPYDVSNMDFFTMLQKHVSSPDKLVPVTIDDVLAGRVDLTTFDTVIAADRTYLPGYLPADAGEPVAKRTEPQAPINGTIAAGAPGAGTRTPATSSFFEFDVEAGNDVMDVLVTSPTVVDPDIYLQRQSDDGSWSGDLAAGTSGQTLQETMTYASPPAGHYRVEVHNWAGAPGTADVEITFRLTGAAAETPDAPAAPTVSAWSESQFTAFNTSVKRFVENGGNLILTDDALQALGYLGVTPAEAVGMSKVYAGFVQFSTDGGGDETYGHPLAANVDQPGAAEGSGHRHQVGEPVPTGFAVDDDRVGDQHPQWWVNREAFEAAGGDMVGAVQDPAQVTLGEIPLGDGKIRILGHLLPFPTDEFDHQFGLGSYALTYSGYEVLRNLMDHTNANGAAPAPVTPAPEPAPGTDGPLPTTGGGAALFLAGLLGLGSSAALRRRRGLI